MEIASCSFTNSQAHVTLEIPVRRAAKTHKIFEIIPVQYGYKKTNCILNSLERIFAQDNDGRITTITEHLKPTCNIAEGKACYVPLFTENPTPFDQCARQLLTESSPINMAKVQKL